MRACEGLTRECIAELNFAAALLPCVLVVTQLAVPSLKLYNKSSKRQVECAGDILEAVGGICHPWRAEARVARSHLAGPHLTPVQSHEARNLLGSLAQR